MESYSDENISPTTAVSRSDEKVRVRVQTPLNQKINNKDFFDFESITSGSSTQQSDLYQRPISSLRILDVLKDTQSNDPEQLREVINSLNSRIQYLEQTLDSLYEMRILKKERETEKYKIRELDIEENHITNFLNESFHEVEEFQNIKLNKDEEDSKLVVWVTYNKNLSINSRRKIAKIERILKDGFKVKYELILKRNS